MTVVYVLREEDGPIKIGMSDNLPWRIETLQRERVGQLSLVGTVEFPNRKVARAVERTAHYLLRQMREAGEWFDVTDEAAEEAINAAITRCKDGTAPDNYRGTLVGVRMDNVMLARLDKHRGGQTRPQAIREILEKNLP